MQEKLALNIKIPRLGKNRLGVFFVRSSHADPSGKRCVTQLSLQTKDPGLAKLLGLKFCIHLAQGGNLADFRLGLSTYIVDLENGRFEANGEDDHRRALEAQRLALQLQEKKLEAQRLAIQLAQIRAQEYEAARIHQAKNSPVGLEVAKVMAELFPDGGWAPGVEHTMQSPLQNAPNMAPPVDDSSASVAAMAMHDKRTASAPTQRLPALKVSARPEIRLQDEMNRHLVEEANTDIQDQTIGEKRAVFEDFLSCFGDDTPLNAVTRDEVTHRWRNEEYNRKNRKDLEKQAKLQAEGNGETVEVKNLSPGRIEKRRGYLVKFFTWATDAGTYKHANPMSQKMFTKQQIQKATEPYREFSNEDIRALFTSEYIKDMVNPDWYWVPLISLYSGARLGEVSNMQVTTFQIVDGIKVFLVTDGKNNASKRTVPIHSKLLQLGLWEYAEGLKTRGCTYLFPDEPEAYRSKSTGRKWGQWVSECGITDDNKTFHSFRSTAITDMHNAEEAQAGHVAIRRSVGHATAGASGAHGHYVRGLNLKKLQSAIESVDHDHFDVAQLRLADPAFTQYFDKHFALVNSPGHLARKQRKENHNKAKAARLSTAQR